MHGLSTHGIAASGAVDAPLMAMDHSAGVTHDGAQAGTAGPGEHHEGLAMMCLAILVAAIAMVWLGRLLDRRPVFTAERLRGRFLPRPGITHPPPLAHFSVMRC